MPFHGVVILLAKVKAFQNFTTFKFLHPLAINELQSALFPFANSRNFQNKIDQSTITAMPTRRYVFRSKQFLSSSTLQHQQLATNYSSSSINNCSTTQHNTSSYADSDVDMARLNTNKPTDGQAGLQHTGGATTVGRRSAADSQDRNKKNSKSYDMTANVAEQQRTEIIGAPVVIDLVDTDTETSRPRRTAETGSFAIFSEQHDDDGNGEEVHDGFDPTTLRPGWLQMNALNTCTQPRYVNGEWKTDSIKHEYGDDDDKENSLDFIKLECDEEEENNSYPAAWLSSPPPLAGNAGRRVFEGCGVDDEGEDTGNDGDEEDEDEDAHDSLDGFIVSDSEALSYYDTSNAEIQDEGIDESHCSSSASSPLPSVRGYGRTHRERFAEADSLGSFIVSDTEEISLCDKSDTEEGNHQSQKEAIPTARSSVASHSSSPPPLRRSPRKQLPKPPSEWKVPKKKTCFRQSFVNELNTPLRGETSEEADPRIDQQSPPETDQFRKVLELLCDDLEETTLEGPSDPKEKQLAKPPGPQTPISKKAQRKADVEQSKIARKRKQSFDRKKRSFADEFLKALDDAVTGGQVQKMASMTGGVRIVWLSTLKTTAGRARWSGVPAGSSAMGDRGLIHHAVIELADHVVDDEERIINTLTHEYCHLANYMISGNARRERAHGRGFIEWGRKCQQALREHPVYGGDRINTVTTRHNYQINFKYTWSCQGCGTLFHRHSKSIDTDKVVCGRCRGHLQQIKPKPRIGA